MKKIKTLAIYAILIAIVVGVVVWLTNMGKDNSILYSELISEIKAGNVESITIDNDLIATVVLKSQSQEYERPGKNGEIIKKVLDAKKEYKVDIMGFEEFQGYVTSILDEAAANNQPAPFVFNEKITHVPAWVEYIPYVLMILVVVLFIFMFMGQNSQGKIASVSRSRARVTLSKVKFDDVAGADEEKEEMQELVAFLKDPSKYTKLGARIPKGVLLVGPPGTGKTYLAKAVAGEAGVPFFSISGSDFVELYVGVGAARVRDMFEQAKKNAPCIVFIDEIDAVGRHRGAGLGGGHDEREQTLNQLLVEMDGFAIHESVIVLAATNRPDILDPALTRPGRFDRRIVVGLPDVKAREQMLGIHTRKKPIAEEVKLSEVAKETVGFTPADLENLMNEAALLAAREDSPEIKIKHIKEAVFKVRVGTEKKSRVMTEKDKKLTAIHESGHALAVRFFSSTDRVDRVSIIPAGMAGGYTAYSADNDETFVTKSQLFEKIVVALGGKAAEELFIGDVSTGASSDLKSANSIAMSMVTKYGMSESIGNVILDSGNEEVFLAMEHRGNRTVSEELSSKVDREVKKIIDEAYAKVKEILEEHRDTLMRLTEELLKKEKIEGDEFEAIVNPSKEESAPEACAENNSIDANV